MKSEKNKIAFERLTEKIKRILDGFSDKQSFKVVVDELCKNGVGKGCYKDYGDLCDVLEVLTSCENYLEEIGE